MKYSKSEEYRMQVAEGLRRHREEVANIYRIPERRCTFEEAGKKLFGTAIGAFKNNSDLHSAYHIKADDGRELTIKSSLVTIDAAY